MTIPEFRAFKFKAGDQFLYQGKVYDLITVDFQEDLIGLDIDGTVQWVRCENVKLQ